MEEIKEFPEELLKDFMTEIEEHSELIEEDLLDIEGGEGSGSLDRLFRAIHSIKGSASWVGFKKLVELCHQGEEILNDVRKRGASMESERIDLLLEMLDAIKKVQESGSDNHEEIGVTVTNMSDFRKLKKSGRKREAMKDELTIWKSAEGDVSVLLLEGNLGVMGTDKLVSEFVRLEDEERYRLVLDIERISFICSSGLGGLAITLKNFREKGGDLKLVNPTGDVKEKLDITELNKQFEICESVKEALAGFDLL